MKCRKQINQLRQAIKSGQMAPGDMVGTEFAFSQKWGFARNTVRRGIQTLVQEGLLERRPGKGLFVRPTNSTTRTVQVVVPNLAWPHFLKVARGAQAAGRECGVQTLVYDAHGRMDLDLEMIRQLPKSSADGAIIISLHHRRFTEILFELKAAGYPLVLVDQRVHDLEVPTVESDNYGGGYTVGKHLAELGHRRIAFIGPLNFRVVTDRLNGFRDGLTDAGVLFDRSLLVDFEAQGLTDWINEQAPTTEETLLPLLTRPDRPTVIFDGSGDLAPFIYRAAQRVGLRVPHDISVATFDDSPLGGFLEPEVARLKHGWLEIGKSALEALVRQMSNPSTRADSKPAEHHVLPVEWAPGPSLIPLPQSAPSHP